MLKTIQTNLLCISIAIFDEESIKTINYEIMYAKLVKFNQQIKLLIFSSSNPKKIFLIASSIIINYGLIWKIKS
jgi:hypothetical protein